MATSDKVLLRVGSHGRTQEFDADHAKRLLAYAGSQWQPVAEEEEEKPAKGKKPSPDATGQPEAI